MSQYIIKDWAGNRIKSDKSFDDFESAWDFILGELTDELKLTEEDLGEYYVEVES